MDPALSADWYFSFGFGQPHYRCYVKIHGTFQGAREGMIRRYGLVWSMQYNESEGLQRIEKWGWTAAPTDSETVPKSH